MDGFIEPAARLGGVAKAMVREARPDIFARIYAAGLVQALARRVPSRL